VYKRCRVEQFSKESEKWEEGEVSNAKKRGLFEDLLASDDDDEGGPKDKPKKRAKSGDKAEEHRGEKREKKEKKGKKKGTEEEDDEAEVEARKLGGGALEGGMSVLGYSKETAAKGTGKKVLSLPIIPTPCGTMSEGQCHGDFTLMWIARQSLETPAPCS
jgi:hypothetical protein